MSPPQRLPVVWPARGQSLALRSLGPGAEGRGRGRDPSWKGLQLEVSKTLGKLVWLCTTSSVTCLLKSCSFSEREKATRFGSCPLVVPLP